MDKMLYIAASGARQIMHAQTVNAHNLASATITGFQADLAAMKSLPVYGDGWESRVFSLIESAGVDFGKGAIQQTGRELDVAVNGPGWIAVQAPDGSEAYTRAGDLRISSEGMLETGAGYPVLGDAGPMLIPEAEKIDIGEDGTVSVLPLGQDPTTLADIGRIKLVSPEPALLEKGSEGLLRMRDGSPPPPAADVRLVAGAVEASNVNLVEAMTSMIELARSFETHIKLLETARDNDAASARVMNISS